MYLSKRTRQNLFSNDMGYGGFKDLTRRITFDEILSNKVFDIAKNHKYDGYKGGLASNGYNCFDKKSSGSGIKS